MAANRGCAARWASLWWAGPITQTGIVATVEHEKPHNGVAYEHFLPAGPFAILPMTGNRSSLVWTEGTHKAPALLGAGR
jgi:2-octaprenyl-6-methoxyphenol hydroxylase